MRAYGALSPIDQIPLPPDTVQTLLIAGSSGQAMDWAGSTVGSSAVAAHLARFSGVSTVGALLNFWINLNSTRAAAPSSGLSTGSTAGALPDIPVQGSRIVQIPPGSTGFSVAGLSSGYINVEVWRK